MKKTLLIPLCGLCGINEATQTNSHIFSSFLTTSLKIVEQKRRVYKLDKHRPDQKYEHKQDSPKEDHILCPVCEKLLADKYETPVANTFWNDFTNDRNNFTVDLFNRLQYKVFLRPDYILFKKFICTQLFRASLSKYDAFKTISLAPAHVDILKSNLLEDKTFHDLSVIAVATSKNPDPTANILLGIRLTTKRYLLWINEIFFIIDIEQGEELIPEFEEAKMLNTNSIRICIVPLNLWFAFRTHWFDLIKKK